MLVSPSSITTIVKRGICIVVWRNQYFLVKVAFFGKSSQKQTLIFIYLSLGNTNGNCPDQQGTVRNKYVINKLLTFTSPPTYFVQM